MTLRLRITLLVALAVAVAVAAVAGTAWVLTARELRGEVDQFLHDRAAAAGIAVGLGTEAGEQFEQRRGRFPGARGQFNPGILQQPDAVVQIISADGTVLVVVGQSTRLPVEEIDFEIANGNSSAMFRDAEIEDEHYRIYTTPAVGDTAVQIGRSLEEVDSVLDSLVMKAVLIGAVGVAAAALLGWFVASRALIPVGALTTAAEHVADTQQLDAKIEVGRSDELGSLANSFNSMLDALSESRDQQQRLVADASHELRTPLTSLRTNIEVLNRATGMSLEERTTLLDDVTAELAELTELVTELVELATDAREDREPTDVRLDELAERVAERARRRSGMTVLVDVEPTIVQAVLDRLERAAGNLVDNAIKWSPAGGVVDIAAKGGKFEVRDQGPGIASDDLPHVFDRFYRAPDARSKPGSGLGLAIVEQIITAFGGTVTAANAPDGGAIVAFELPATAPDFAEVDA